MNQEFYNHVAVITALIISFAFLIGAHPFKRKSQRINDALDEDRAPWYAHEYKDFLIKKIEATNNMDELLDTLVLIDGYYDKPFRKPISRFTINRYFIELTQAYADKEDEFLNQPVELCKN